MTEKMEFPIKGHEACPECGSTECIGALYIEQLKDDGKLPKDFPNRLRVLFPLFTQEMIPKLVMTTLAGNPKVPLLLVSIGICKECECLYLVGVDVEWQEVKVQFMQGKPPPKIR